MSTTALIRDYLLECAKEHEWKEDHYVIGIKCLGMQCGTFIRDFGSFSIYEQILRWNHVGDSVGLSKTSADGIYQMEPLKVSLCDPKSLDKIKSYFAG